MDKAIPIYSNCDIQENILYYYCSECKGEIEISNILPVSLQNLAESPPL